MQAESDKQQGSDERGEQHPLGEGFGALTMTSAADIGRHAGLQAGLIAGHQQRLAGRKVRKPAATQSSPSRWYFMVISAVATTSAAPSIFQSVSRDGVLATKVPALP
jgi:hypothetical protein